MFFQRRPCLLPVVCLLPFVASWTEPVLARTSESSPPITHRVHKRAETPSPGEAPTGSVVAAPQPNANSFPEIKFLPYFRAVPKGEVRSIGFFTYLYPDCSPQGAVVARLTTKPQHGTVTFQQEESFPRYAPTSPMVSCNAKKVPGVKMTYAVEEGFEGVDTYSVLMINPDGTVTGYDVKVSVR